MISRALKRSFFIFFFFLSSNFLFLFPFIHRSNYSIQVSGHCWFFEFSFHFFHFHSFIFFSFSFYSSSVHFRWDAWIFVFFRALGVFWRRFRLGIFFSFFFLFFLFFLSFLFFFSFFFLFLFLFFSFFCFFFSRINQVAGFESGRKFKFFSSKQ